MRAFVLRPKIQCARQEMAYRMKEWYRVNDLKRTVLQKTARDHF